jgi:hypothetical protein
MKFITLIALLTLTVACEDATPTPTTDAGTTAAQTAVQVDAGTTAAQTAAQVDAGTTAAQVDAGGD